MYKRIIIPTLLLSLTACVDLSGSRSTYMHGLWSQSFQHSSVYHGEVHTMRGGLGIFSIGMNQLRDAVIQEDKIPAYSTMWYNAGDVTRFIVASYYREKHPYPIILVGHSLGANEQIKVARNLNQYGIPVALLVTVDAVSQTIVPPNVHYALNLYKPGIVPMFSGLRLRAVDPTKTKIDNINVTTLPDMKVNHFTIDKDKVVQAMILAHIKQVLIDAKQKKG